MAVYDPDEDTEYLMSDYDDYQVIPRPQELIDEQLRSSSKKCSKRKSETSRKESRRSKAEKNSKIKKDTSKDGKKHRSHSKEKVSKSHLSSVVAKKERGDELEQKFQSFLAGANTTLSKNKMEITSKHSGPDVEENVKDSCGAYDQLLKLLEQPAVTAEERLKILIARDTAIRLKEAKRGESKQKKIFGCCPDMCPEKERYSRLAKNCLSALEYNSAFDSTLSREANHRYMVKEYSRSSADQLLPLPHELRPASVLIFTMNYLICNIMDLKMDNISISDWYDFIWNRTRSIRKDLTQQELCDKECVQIIEKCIRFHIHCAEALSEEDLATFDPKINNENLTKCLQTLKHMYHDLQSKGISCPNEAEFRAYDILLSLTEGETLRLIKDIRKEILKSPLVKSAFQAALAFKSQNFVKFFNIFAKATYLSSCIMHRYVNQAREQALQVMVRAYSTANHSTSYPTLNLVRDLKFENVDEAINFCKFYGFSSNETSVTIERTAYSKPASLPPVSRSYFLIGKKLTTSLGEIINNGPLPKNPLDWYTPHESFDERNMLKTESIDAVDQEFTSLKSSNSSYLEEVPKSTTTSASTTFLIESKRDFAFKDTFLKSQLTNLKTSKLTDLKTSKMIDTPGLKKFSAFLKNDSAPKVSLEAKSSEGFKIKSDTDNLSLFFQKPQKTDEKSYAVHSSDGESSVLTTSVVSKHDLDKSKHFVSDLSGDKYGQITSKAQDTVSKPAGKNIIDTEQTKQSKTDVKLTEMFFPAKFSSFADAALKSPLAKSFSTVLGNDDPVDKIDTSLPSLPPVRSLPTDLFKHVGSEADSTNVVDLPDRLSDENSILSLEAAESSLSVESLLQVEEDLISKIQEEENLLEEEACDDILEVICSEYMRESLEKICKDVISDELKVKAQLDDTLLKIRLELAEKAFFKWKLFCERRKLRKIQENNVPNSPWVPMLTNTEYFTSGVSSPVSIYKKHCSLSKMIDKKIKEKSQVKPGWERFKANDFSHLWKLQNIYPVYLENSGLIKFFKLNLVFPDCNYEMSQTKDWIKSKFFLCESSEIADSKSNLLSFYTLSTGKIVFCARALMLETEKPFDCFDYLDGISAMLLFLPENFPNSEVFENFLQSFSCLLNADKLMYAYPLFVFLVPSKEKYSIVSRLDSYLDENLQCGMFSVFNMKILMNDQTEGSKQLLLAVNWLIEKQKVYPTILKSTIKDFLDDSFAFAFSILYRKVPLIEFKLLKMMPHQLIEIYNKALSIRASLLVSDLLHRVAMSWPPTELKYYCRKEAFVDMEVQRETEEFMKKLLLPEFDGDPRIHEDVWIYVEKVVHISSCNFNMLIVSVESILERSIPIDWLSIINKCAYHLVSSQSIAFLQNLKERKKRNIIYYMKDDIDAFDLEDIWQETLLDLNEFHFNRKRKQLVLDELLCKKQKLEAFNEVPEASVLSTSVKPAGLSDSVNLQLESIFSPLREALKKCTTESNEFQCRLDETIKSDNIIEDVPSFMDKTSERNILNVKYPYLSQMSMEKLSESLKFTQSNLNNSDCILLKL
ncbi:uncharacterized protein LOC129234667 [Uloborus diversus]|uniref:uncharacterized protein LOC129234667 n=1 Tax=Uloborus diversus TaxID=327109 RepID=UPI00240989C3|nr:uncharacterized protein LOC129234667 [Uloborus diversus]